MSINQLQASKSQFFRSVTFVRALAILSLINNDAVSWEPGVVANKLVIVILHSACCALRFYHVQFEIKHDFVGLLATFFSVKVWIHGFD